VYLSGRQVNTNSRASLITHAWRSQFSHGSYSAQRAPSVSATCNPVLLGPVPTRGQPGSRTDNPWRRRVAPRSQWPVGRRSSSSSPIMICRDPASWRRVPEDHSDQTRPRRRGLGDGHRAPIPLRRSCWLSARLALRALPGTALGALATVDRVAGGVGRGGCRRTDAADAPLRHGPPEPRRVGIDLDGGMRWLVPTASFPPTWSGGNRRVCRGCAPDVDTGVTHGDLQSPTCSSRRCRDHRVIELVRGGRGECPTTSPS